MPATNRKETTKSKNSSPMKHRYARNTQEFAQNEGHTVSRLLWQKIMAGSSPKIQQMLLTFLDLRDMLHLIVPEAYVPTIDQPVDHKRLVAVVQKAEKFLTTPDENIEDI